MPKAYLIANIRIHDLEKFAEFRQMSTPVIADFNGRVLVRNPNPDFREGDLRGMSIVVEFDTMADATAFYESDGYSAARLVRELAADTDLQLVEGV